MKFLKQNKRFTAGLSTVALSTLATPAFAQLDDGSSIVSGLGSLATTAGLVVAALIAFGVAWYLGKKVYMMTKA